jgi:glutathione S-transferase
MAELTLVVGNRNYSSWSLRAWSMLRHLGLEFAEQRLPLDTPEFHAGIARYTGAGRVPVLLHGRLRVWESIAIIEYASELVNGRGWPVARPARAEARAVAAEMHAGFAPLRSAYPMNIRARDRLIPMTAALAGSIRRIDLLWSDCRRRHGAGGPWLFGAYSGVDAMYLPVAFRFQTYGSAGLGAESLAYVRTALADPLLEPWIVAAETESETLAADEVGIRPAGSQPEGRSHDE